MSIGFSVYFGLDNTKEENINLLKDYDEKEGYLTVDIKKHTTIIDILIENMLELLLELEEDYQNYIKIEK